MSADTAVFVGPNRRCAIDSTTPQPGGGWVGFRNGFLREEPYEPPPQISEIVDSGPDLIHVYHNYEAL